METKTKRHPSGSTHAVGPDLDGHFLQVDVYAANIGTGWDGATVTLYAVCGRARVAVAHGAVRGTSAQHVLSSAPPAADRYELEVDATSAPAGTIDISARGSMASRQSDDMRTAKNHTEVTPSDDAVQRFSSFMTLDSGDVAYVPAGACSSGASITLASVPAFTHFQIAVSKILATGTTATVLGMFD